jgi:hypothetical protein
MLTGFAAPALNFRFQVSGFKFLNGRQSGSASGIPLTASQIKQRIAT